MNRAEQAQQAELFRGKHRGPRLLLLPNAWDAMSARVFAGAGFDAIATTSGDRGVTPAMKASGDRAIVMPTKASGDCVVVMAMRMGPSGKSGLAPTSPACVVAIANVASTSAHRKSRARRLSRMMMSRVSATAMGANDRANAKVAAKPNGRE